MNNVHIFFSDLHSNYSALQSFSEYLENINEDVQLYFLGDLIGYYTFDMRIIEVFEKFKIKYNMRMLLGNHDAAFLNEFFGADYKISCISQFDDSIKKDITVRNKIHGILPLDKTLNSFDISGRKIVVSHGGIGNPLNDYYYPDMKFLIENRKLFGHDTDYIIGHTHHPFIFEDKLLNTKIINIGSIGMPRNHDCRGSFLEISNDGKFAIKKIEYDLDALYDYNFKIDNCVKNRAYFGGNSRFLNKNLIDFDSDDQNVIRNLNNVKKSYKKIIIFHNENRLLKLTDGYLTFRKDKEELFNNIISAIKECDSNEI